MVLSASFRRDLDSMFESESSAMQDTATGTVRSKMMSAVRQRHTAPERSVAEAVRRLGISYRLNSSSLAGSPDLSNRSGGWAIFVNGCFWHGHKNCSKTKGGAFSRIPVTRSEFWSEKFRANRNRDARKCRELRRLGLRVAIVWECELTDGVATRQRLVRFLSAAKASKARRRGDPRKGTHGKPL